MSDSDSGALAMNKLQSTVVTSINQSSASLIASSTSSPSISVMASNSSATSTKPAANEKRHAVISSMIAGALAGATAKTVIAPLDRTKIYFQTHPEKNYRLGRAFKYIHNTFKTEGFFYLWRGNSATMARIVPYASMQFLAHEQYKSFFGIHQDQLKDRPTNGEDKVRLGQLHFAAGALAGMTGQALTYPLDRARAVMAVTRVGEYKNLADVFRRIVRHEGWFSLYRGFVPTILGVIPYAGTSFFTYEQLKSFWTNRAKRLNPDDKRPGPTTAQRLASGALAGLLGQTASYPLDIVRRRMQTSTQMGVPGNRYVTVGGALIVILRKEGFRKGWYKGVSMNFIKGPIAVGTSFATYDYFSVFIKKCLKSMSG